MNESFQSILIIISPLLSWFSIYITADFMNKFGRKIYAEKYAYIISFGTFYIIVGMCSSILGNTFINILISLIGTVMIGHYLYNDEKIYTMYYSMFIIIMAVLQIIFSYMFSIICTTMHIDFQSIEMYLVANGFVVQFANLITSRLFIYFYKNKEIKNLTKVQFLNFLVLPLFSIFYIVTLTKYMENYTSVQEAIFLIINIVTIIILNIYITNIFEAISKNNEMQNELALYNQQSNMQYDYYNSLESKYNASRKIIHDIKNHIANLETLYGLGEEEKARYYTEDLQSMFKGFEQKLYTDNKMLNIIINDKLEAAKTVGVDLECKIGLVNMEFIKDIDITTIFANLLDNAIDEVKSLDKNKKIYLNVDQFNDFLVINIRNLLKSKPIETEEGFKTTKRDHQGLGIKNVKKAIEDYDGNLRINFEEEFKVNIVIPIN